MSATTEKVFLYGPQGLGCVAGVVGLLMGIWSCVNFSCLIGGIILSTIAFFVTAVEAPYCCMMFEFTDKLYNISQGVPCLVKSVVYIIAGVIPVLLCPLTIPVWLGSGLIAATGVLYGAKAMRRDKVEPPAGPTEDTELNSSKTNLVNKE